MLNLHIGNQSSIAATVPLPYGCPLPTWVWHSVPGHPLNGCSPFQFPNPTPGPPLSGHLASWSSSDSSGWIPPHSSPQIPLTSMDAPFTCLGLWLPIPHASPTLLVDAYLALPHLMASGLNWREERGNRGRKGKGRERKGKWANEREEVLYFLKIQIIHEHFLDLKFFSSYILSY